MTLSRRTFLAAVAAMLGMPKPELAPCPACSKPQPTTITFRLGTVPPEFSSLSASPYAACVDFERMIIRWRDANDVWHSSEVDCDDLASA